MAITKIKAIKKTLNKAINYIINPEKTEEGSLVYSFGCSVGTADLEMELTAKKGSGNGNRIAYHVIQSFSPDDPITPEMAFELGKEFASKITNGRYEFVLSTHTDENHIHNHIIINAVDFIDYKKYHYNMKEKYRIRGINDKICKENNLSVIESFSGRRGKSKYEYEQSKAGTSWKDKLAVLIEQTISKVQSFEEFLIIMEMEGYEINQGKHISFRAPGQERFTRAKILGDNYTEEAIRTRIENKEKINSVEQHPADDKLITENIKDIQIPKTGKKEKVVSKQSSKFYQKRINLLVDISKNIKAQQSKGYEQALVRSNINTLTKTMNYLIEHKITTSDEFVIFAQGMRAEYKLNQKGIKKIESELLDLSQKIKFTQNYKKYRAVYLESQRSRQKNEFYHEHEDEIVLYKASEMYFERNQVEPKTLNLSILFEEYKALNQEKKEILKHCNTLRKSINEMETVEKNIEIALNVDLEENNSMRQNNNRENTQNSGRDNGGKDIQI